MSINFDPSVNGNLIQSNKRKAHSSEESPIGPQLYEEPIGPQLEENPNSKRRDTQDLRDAVSRAGPPPSNNALASAINNLGDAAAHRMVTTNNVSDIPRASLPVISNVRNVRASRQRDNLPIASESGVILIFNQSIASNLRPAQQHRSMPNMVTTNNVSDIPRASLPVISNVRNVRASRQRDNLPIASESGVILRSNQSIASHLRPAQQHRSMPNIEDNNAHTTCNRVGAGLEATALFLGTKVAAAGVTTLKPVIGFASGAAALCGNPFERYERMVNSSKKLGIEMNNIMGNCISIAMAEQPDNKATSNKLTEFSKKVDNCIEAVGTIPAVAAGAVGIIGPALVAVPAGLVVAGIVSVATTAITAGAAFILVSYGLHRLNHG